MMPNGATSEALANLWDAGERGHLARGVRKNFLARAPNQVENSIILLIIVTDKIPLKILKHAISREKIIFSGKEAELPPTHLSIAEELLPPHIYRSPTKPPRFAPVVWCTTYGNWARKMSGARERKINWRGKRGALIA